MSTRSRYALSTLLVSMTLVAASRPTSAATLTGAGLFPVEANGDWGGFHLWNTVPDGFYWNLFLTDGDPATGPFVNGPTDATIAPRLTLAPGRHSFGLLAVSPPPDSGFDTGFAGLTLHFDDGATPAIAVKTATGPVGSPSGMSGTVAGPLGEALPGPGMLSYSDGQFTVEVTDFQLEARPAVSLDRVGAFDVGPSGVPNLYGQLTLLVTPVPEPTAPGAVLLATVLAAVCRRRV